MRAAAQFEPLDDSLETMASRCAAVGALAALLRAAASSALPAAARAPAPAALAAALAALGRDALRNPARRGLASAAAEALADADAAAAAAAAADAAAAAADAAADAAYDVDAESAAADFRRSDLVFRVSLADDSATVLWPPDLPAAAGAELQRGLDHLVAVAPALGAARRRLARALLRAAYHGFNAEGAFFERPADAPEVPTLAGEVRPVAAALLAIPGARLLHCILSSPHMLSPHYGGAARMAETGAWLTARLGLEGRELGRVANGNPFLLVRSAAATEASLAALEALGLRGAALRTAVLRQPRVAGMRAPRIAGKGAALAEAAKLDAAALRAVLLAHPGVLALDLRARLAALAAWLDRHGIGADALPAAVRRQPALLAYSIQENLDPTARMLAEEAGLPPAALRRAATQTPDVFGRRPETLRRNAAALRAAGLDAPALARLAAAWPGVLRLDVGAEPYATKLRFLREGLSLRGEALAAALVTNPMYLTFGVERIAARAAFLRVCGRGTASLTAWLSASDERFAALFARSAPGEWEDFLPRWRAGADAARWLGARADGASRARRFPHVFKG